ncbi:MAG: NUDIX domain-containing protein [Candidatus Nanohaloarchaea archaeon]|nr:NUDIX domain-containing protein [Candidatus Nanohaloarchaea archaeon]
MEQVPGVVVVLYKRVDGYNRYAVLKRTKNWEGWELVKGHIEDKEEPEEAAHREVREETGITPENVQSMDEINEWEYKRDGTQYHARYRAYLAEAPSDAYIDVSGNEHGEHSKGHFLNFRDTVEILTHDNQRELVKQAADQLAEE